MSRCVKGLIFIDKAPRRIKLYRRLYALVRYSNSFEKTVPESADPIDIMPSAVPLYLSKYIIVNT